MVTDAAFYLQDSDMTAVYDIVVPCTIDPVWTDVQVLTSQNVYMNRSVYISTVALYIPVEQSVSSLCTLTFYGPGCLPLDVTVVCPLLASVDWSRFKLKVDSELLPTYKGLLPHHASVGLKTSERGCDIGCFVIQVFILLQFADTNETLADYQEMNQNVASVLQECTSTMISVIQKITDKLLQPVVNKAKNRDIVMRSISGICKAVTDIVSMSSNEQFRTATLQYMKVKDTVELGVEMKCKLTEISQRKHAAVWTGSQRKYSSNSKMDQKLQSESKGSQDSWFDAGTISDAVTSDRNIVIDQTDCIGYAGNGDRTDVHGNRTVEEQQDSNKISDINRNSIIITDQTINTCPSLYNATLHRNNDGTLSDIDKQTEENCVSRFESKCVNQNKTPDIRTIIEDMEKVSPFQQLVMENHNACMDITPDLMQITQRMKDVSPFQHINEDDQVNSIHAEISIEDPCPRDSQTVPDRQSKVKVMTPDLVHVIQGMKDVSPFQQLACDDQIVPASPNINTEDPCLSQQVHDKIQHCPDIAHATEHIYLNKGRNYVNNFNHKQYTSHNSYQNQRSAKFETSHNEKHSDSSQRTSKIPKLLRSKTDKVTTNFLKTDLQESDLEILKSEEFGATLEVVTEFIDEMKCMEEFPTITDQTEESKYGTVVKDKQNVNTAEKLSHDSDITQNSKTGDDIDNNEDISKDDDDHDKGLEKQTGRDKHDIDDWFNDVLLEVGEWFD
ncbi:uncharacterized protein LOC132739247 [Ruditapes philippinarum]|uniref:uncharacterized protein LOC132739247 n=1 Tax=Ruditapes philippinarum TaxID=129788 RepID=UPI00295A85F7|nr:uncharacterized protein LOC132739247 [Ruditapes philippinarum]